MSQSELAAQTRIDAVQINRYARDRARITWKNFEKILAVFPPEHQAQLLRAYLLDAVPPQWHSLFEIHALVLGLVNETKPLPAEFEALDEKLAEAFRFVASKSDQPAIRDLVMDLARLLRGEITRPTRTATHLSSQEQRRAEGELRKAEKAQPPLALKRSSRP